MTTYLKSFSLGVADERAREASPKAHSISVAGHVVQHVEQVVDVEADVERVAGVLHFDLLLRLLLLGVGGDDLQAASVSTQRTPRNFSFDRIAARCSAWRSGSRSICSRFLCWVGITRV